MERNLIILLTAIGIVACGSIFCPLTMMAQQGMRPDTAALQGVSATLKRGLISNTKITLPAQGVDGLLKKQLRTYHLPKFSTPWMALGNGRLDYTYYYRSNTDTPFVQQGVYQHQINASAGVMLGSVLPFKVNAQIRRSNSLLFRNITDVQVMFDVTAFQQQTYKNVVEHFASMAHLLKDSITGVLSHLKRQEYQLTLDDFNSKFSAQQLIEARELLQVPQLSWDHSLPDSLAAAKSDSILRMTRLFLTQYDSAKAKLDAVKGMADSLKAVYDQSLALFNKVKNLSKGNESAAEALEQIGNVAAWKGKAKSLIPPSLWWMLSIRTLSIGRSPINYSDLTAKNVMLNGVNIAYNSWYYISASAGMINYRFRDFLINNADRPKQYFYMGRLGIGKLEKNYFIVSVYHGKKQVFASGAINRLYPVVTTGISTEGRWQFNKHSYIKAEIATSVAPDFSQVPIKNNKLSFSGKQDKAIALNARLAWPKMQAKLELFYRYTGANFQSFSTFQNNSSIVAWGIKAEQQLFNNVLRITASIKSNDFSNPYLPQRYRSNMVFKTVQVAFRKKKWPVISAGLMPLTQLTNVDGTLYENQFHALNASLYHHYRLAGIKGATAVVFTQFRNNAADTGLLYFNSINVFANQVCYFNRFTATMTVTHSTNKNYELNVVSESIDVPFRKIATATVGFKVNNLNKQTTLTGVFGGLRFQFMRRISLNMMCEKGYMPGLNGMLIRNDIGSIQLSTTF